MRKHIHIVTGANRGLGRSIVKSIAKGVSADEAQHIILVGRERRSLEAVSAEVVSTNVHTYIVPEIELSQPAADITSVIMAKLKEVSDAIATNGTLRFTLFQCAGSIGDLSKTVAEYTESEIAAYTAINFISYTAIISRFLAFLKTVSMSAKVDRICIVNISSLLAVSPFVNWGLYASIKAARDQLLKVVALEHKDDSRVKVLSYAPGPLDGDMQADVRATIGDKEQQKSYTSMYQDNKLVKPQVTADEMLRLLNEWSFESGAHIDIFDLMPPPS